MQTTTLPSYPDCPTALSPEQLAQFQEQGFLAFEHVLSCDEVANVNAEFTRLVKEYAFDDARTTYKPTKDGRAYGALFHKRDSRFFFEIEKGYVPTIEDKDALELKVRKLMFFEEEASIFQKIAHTHPHVAGVLRSLLGEGAKLFQSMALIKPPQIGREKPWHQDNAYFAVTPIDSVIGVWFALDDATVENGCMHLIPGAHELGPLKHHHTHDCEIEEGRIDKQQAVPVPLKQGGAMFFYGLLPHFTPPNRSGKRRRSLQYHYHAAHCKVVEQEAYNVAFAEADGTPASCRAASLQKEI